MPWAVQVSLDEDKTTTGAEVGNITATFTDAAQFVVPFVVSKRSEIKASDLTPFKNFCIAALAAETQKRTREANRATAIQNSLNS